MAFKDHRALRMCMPCAFSPADQAGKQPAVWQQPANGPSAAVQPPVRRRVPQVGWLSLGGTLSMVAVVAIAFVKILLLQPGSLQQSGGGSSWAGGAEPSNPPTLASSDVRLGLVAFMDVVFSYGGAANWLRCVPLWWAGRAWTGMDVQNSCGVRLVQSRAVSLRVAYRRRLTVSCHGLISSPCHPGGCRYITGMQQRAHFTRVASTGSAFMTLCYVALGAAGYARLGQNFDRSKPITSVLPYDGWTVAANAALLLHCVVAYQVCFCRGGVGPGGAGLGRAGALGSRAFTGKRTLRTGCSAGGARTRWL